MECYHRNARGRGPDQQPFDLEQGICRSCRHSHPSVLVAVEAFQADLALAKQMIDLDARGQLPVFKRVKRSTHQLQRHLRSLCEDRPDGRKSVAETLRGLGHCIRFEH